jgi:AcrR family transcriptional regulator
MDKPRYHHGDLANALVAAALTAVERAGPEAVSLRDLAQSLGVSRAAPYRHFPDRDSLMAAVAARGFEDLNTLYKAALASPGDGRERLETATRAFFDFAAKRPGLFRLMFDSDLLARDHPPASLIPPADESYRLLWRAVEGAYPDADEREVKARTLTMWSATHGYLSLSRGGRIKPFMIDPLSEEEVVEAVIAAAIGPAAPQRMRWSSAAETASPDSIDGVSTHAARRRGV